MTLERSLWLNRNALAAVALTIGLLSNRPAMAQEPESRPTSQPTEADRGHHGGEHGMPHHFEDAEHWAEVFDDPARDVWQQPEEVIRVMALEPGMTVADIGAGTGYFMPYLSPAVGPEGSVIELDIEETMVAYMQQRAADERLSNVSARVVQPDDPELESDSIDRILIVNTWHHIGDRESYAHLLAEALKPGGAVYIVDYTMESPQGPPPEHRLLPEQVARELEAGGLTVETVDEPLPDQFIIVGWKRDGSTTAAEGP